MCIKLPLDFDISLQKYNFLIMLTKEELTFMDYWEKNRDKEKELSYQLKSGILPGILFTLFILVVTFSGWYMRADMVMNNTGSIITIVIALLIIVFVYAVFSKRQQWDMKQQQYLELKAKQRKMQKNI